MQKFLTFFLLIFLSSALMFGQEGDKKKFLDEPFDARQNIGVTFGLGINLHTGFFQKLPVAPPCCVPEFTTATNFGYNFGIFYGFPLSEDFEMTFRFAYTDLSGDFVETSDEFFSPDFTNSDEPKKSNIEYSLLNSINSAGLQTYLAYRLTEQFKLFGGFHFGYLLTKNAVQEEKILSPQYGVWNENGQRTRATYDGDISEESLEYAMLIGTSYDFPMNEDHTLFIVPEAHFTFGLSSFAPDLGWTANTFRGAVSIKYAPREEMPPPKVYLPPPPPPYPHIGVPPAPPPPPPPPVAFLDAKITAVAVEKNGTESPVSTLRTEEFLMNRTHPILNYVFFEDNSSDIPKRYTRISEEEKAKFSFKRFINEKTMDVYYNVLNILGKRMQFYPQAKVKLVGTNSNRGTEKGNLALSENRAKAIQNFLVNEWKIDPTRISIEKRNLPSNPSNKNDPDGIAENRRVEIIASQAEVFEPVNIRDTLVESNPPHIRFKPVITAEVGVKTWKITTMQEGEILRVFEGTGNVSNAIDWVLASEDEQDYAARLAKPLQYRLEVVDNDGKTWKSPLQTLPVKQLTVETKMWEELEDKEIDKFAMIGFGYNVSKLNDANKYIGDKAKDRIRKKSTTEIEGYSDRLGNDDWNMKLSVRRANETAKYLKVPKKNAVGLGETVFLYDNNTPEGRFYSRTVQINIETPIEN